ncbi:outer mitochondrial transmembrane helix translocase-like [Pelmatolapia mariae]|uniref:outer mitochondrial transmembrane helix translocase-like n=1 Tax=Pelmatolapia mariae TaxID=158779 RepID=UPI002FE5731A
MAPNLAPVGGITLFLGLGLGLIYQLYQVMKQQENPHRQETTRTGQNKAKNVKLSAYEQRIDAHRVDPQTIQITWRDIAGLEEVINELKEKMIFPIRNRHLFRESRLLQPPKGVLLYGPPGCGKTLIAKATAKEAGFAFINLKPSTLTDKWYGESQKLTAAVFSLASKLGPTIIFIDEIDSFLRNRSSRDHEVTAMMKAQFMSLWDGLETDHQCQVIIMGATNRPEDIDPAILRRMPTKIHIKLPNFEQREQILRLILENEMVDPLINLSHIAGETEGFSGSDLKEICREAALLCVQDIIHSDTLSNVRIRPISQNDLQKATRKMKKSKIPGGHGTIFSDDPIRQINQDDLQSNTAGRYSMLPLYIFLFIVIILIFRSDKSLCTLGYHEMSGSSPNVIISIIAVETRLSSLQQDVQVKLGDDVTLQCQISTDEIISVLKWSRADLNTDGYVYFYRNKRSYENYQHPSFHGRVKLRDPEMKDGDVSLILKNVTFNDAGIYECHIAVRKAGR